MRAGGQWHISTIVHKMHMMYNAPMNKKPRNTKPTARKRSAAYRALEKKMLKQMILVCKEAGIPIPPSVEAPKETSSRGKTNRRHRR
jgi:hypothetical protein